MRRPPIEFRTVAIIYTLLGLVPARRQLALESLHEDTEIGRRRRRVHLGDEQDAHRGII